MAPGSNRLLTIGAAAGSLALLAAVVFMLWPSDPMDHALTGREQSDGETVGWVSKVEGNRIHVNAGPFGGGVVPLEVTKHTRITAGAKEGWLEDIRLGGQVKVGYELYQGRRLARTVELLVDDGPRCPIRTEPRVKSTGAGPAAERVPAKPGVATTTTPDGRPASTWKAAEPPPGIAPVAKAEAPKAAPSTPPVVSAPAAALATRPAASTKPAPPAPPEARPAQEPRRAQASEVPPAPRASTAPSQSAAPVESRARAGDGPPAIRGPCRTGERRTRGRARPSSGEQRQQRRLGRGGLVPEGTPVAGATPRRFRLGSRHSRSGSARYRRGPRSQSSRYRRARPPRTR